MPRPRTPTNILSFKGALKHDPKRYAARLNEPLPKGEIGPAPAHLNSDERAVWDEIVTNAPPDTLGAQDRFIIENLATLQARFRNGDTHPRVASEIRQLLQQLGFTPAARSNVSALTSDRGDVPAEQCLAQI